MVKTHFDWWEPDIADDPFSNATFGQIPPLSVIQYRFRVTFRTADVAEVIQAIEAIGGHVKTEILE